MWRSIEVTPKPCKQRNSSALLEPAPVGDSTDEPHTLSSQSNNWFDVSLQYAYRAALCTSEEQRSCLVNRILVYKVTQAFSSVRWLLALGLEDMASFKTWTMVEESQKKAWKFSSLGCKIHFLRLEHDIWAKHGLIEMGRKFRLFISVHRVSVRIWLLFCMNGKGASSAISFVIYVPLRSP